MSRALSSFSEQAVVRDIFKLNAGRYPPKLYQRLPSSARKRSLGESCVAIPWVKGLVWGVVELQIRNCQGGNCAYGCEKNCQILGPSRIEGNYYQGWFLYAVHSARNPEDDSCCRKSRNVARAAGKHFWLRNAESNHRILYREDFQIQLQRLNRSKVISTSCM